MHIYTYENKCPWSPGKCIRAPGVEVRGGCGLPDAGAGN